MSDDNFAVPPIKDITAAHQLWIERSLLPGLAYFKGGARKIKLRRDQEKWTFAVRNYFEGYVITQWEVELQIWTYAQHELACRMMALYAPHPVKGFKEVKYLTFTNPFINNTNFRVGIIEEWAPIATPVKGELLTYSLKINDDYPLAWPPKPAKDKDSKAKVFDMPQPTKAAINPAEALQLPQRMDAAAKGKAEPGEAYQIYDSWMKR